MELIYSIRNIFNDQNNEGCLHQYEADKFLIPTYQRGYKWGSENDNDPVPILLNDLISAFENDANKDYYLQYITISKQGKSLEVIDGQQRLTTLSIFLSIFNLYEFSGANVSENKLHYSIRPSIFDERIYPEEKLKEFLNQDWNRETGILLDGNLINNQDVYFMHSACKKIHSVLENLNGGTENRLLQFYTFLLDHVMLIVNAVESHIPGEKVFRNLNSNQVPLTEVDLIKGLMLTKIARKQEHQNKKHFREILEIRAALGRKWDEMASLSDDPRFSVFFFSHGEGFSGLLELVAVLNGYASGDSTANQSYPLFNFFNNQLHDIHSQFKQLILIFKILQDWYVNPEIYNLLGYAFSSKGNKQSFKSKFIQLNIEKSKSELITALKTHRNEKLADNASGLIYGENNNEIHNVLLALNVFPKNAISYRFDFFTFSELFWTLEHIFPQSPEGKGGKLNKDQKAKIIDMLGGEERIEPKVKRVLRKRERTEEEKEIYYEALQSIGPLNDIGNMALLSDSVNSSIGCGFFDEKRNDILKHIEIGNYVPLHTFNVFSKTILGDKPGNLLAWDGKDIENHSNVIQIRIEELLAESDL